MSFGPIDTEIGGFPREAVTDSMEDGDISEYGGATGQFNATQTRTRIGDWALRGSNTGSTSSIGADSGLSNLPSTGVVLDVWMWVPDAGDLYYTFNNSSGDAETAMQNGDQIQYRNDDNLVLSDGNTDRFAEPLSRSVSQEWIRAQVDWEFSDTTIHIAAFDTGGSSLASADTGLTANYADQNRIGFVVRNVAGSTEGFAYFDHARLTNGF